MSTTIDNRVVEMQFDNKNFESNVKTTLGTLDKLKQSLNLSGASKGLENVSAAAKKCDLAPMGSAVETVRYKFSALEVMAVTALANITNSAVNAGKRIASALTIAPIKSGLQEYETQINAVQTILANTQSKGTTIDQVNAALDELNHYADKTIYNFTEMTRNIGTFTAAGVGLEDSVAAIKGIANLAAVSGSNSQKASMAMYQLSQALAAGRVSLMDWNSVVNAGMGGEVFQNALIRTSELLKTGAKEAIEVEGSFRESLTKHQWLTTEVLTETLKQISGAYSEADLIAQGYTEEQAKDIVQLAKTAESAATDVKTFTQLMDTTKEALQSGWTQTWETIIGDFEEAKEVFSQLSAFFGSIIEDSAEFRNNFLSGALSSGWKQLLNAGITDVEGYKGEVRSLAKENGDAFEKMIQDCGSFEKALPKALKSGIISSKTLSDGLTNLVHKIENMSDEERKAAGYTEENTKQMFELHEALRNGSISMDEFVAKMTRPSGRELIFDSIMNSIRFVHGAIKPISSAFREIFFPQGSSERLYQSIKGLNGFTKGLVITEETADKLQRTFKGLYAAIDIIGTIVGGTLSTAFKIAKGFLSAFDIGILDATANIGDAIVALRDWIDAHFSVEEAAKKVGQAIRVAYGYIRDWINAFLQLPVVQEAIAKFRSVCFSTFDKLGDHINKAAENFAAFIDRVKSMDKIDIGKIVSDFFTNVVKPFLNFDGIFDGVINAVKDFKDKIKKYFDSATDSVSNFVKKVGEFFKTYKNDILIGGILASTLAFAIGFGKIMAKIVKIMAKIVKMLKPFAGIGDAFVGVLDSVSGAIKAFAFKTNAQGVKDIAIALGILAASLVAIALIPADKLRDCVIALSVLALLLGVLTMVAGLVNASAKPLSKLTKSLSSTGSLFMLALSMVAMVSALKIISGLDYSFVDSEGNVIILWKKIATDLGVLAGILAELVVASLALSHFTKKLFKGGLVLLTIAGAVILMAKAIQKIDGLTITNIDQVLGTLVGMVIGLGVLAAVTQTLTWGSAASVLAIVAALVILVNTIDMISNLDMSKAEDNLIAFLSVFGIFAALLWASQFSGANSAKAGLGVLAMSAAMILIVAAIRMIASVPQEDLEKATNTIGIMLIIFGLVTMASYFAGTHAKKAGVMLLAMAGAIAILAAVIAALSLLKPDGIERAKAVIIDLLAVLGMIVIASYAAGEHATKAGMMLLMMSGAITILAAVIWALSKIETGNMWSAVGAIAVLEIAFMALIKITSNANISWATVGQLAIMLVIVGSLAAILWAMSALNVQGALPNAFAISVLLLALVAAMKILQGAATISPMAIVTLGIMAVMAGIIGVIVGLLCKYDLAPSIEAAIGISALVLALSAACLILASVGPVAGAAVAGIGVLFILVGAISVLGYLIAEMAFGLIAQLPAIGKNLSEFMSNVSGFVSGLDDIPLDAGDRSNALKRAILALSVADLIAGLTGISSLPGIGENLSKFMSNCGDFIKGIGSVNESVVTGAQNLSSVIKTLTADDLTAKLKSWVPGKSSLESFGSSLSGFYTEIEGINFSALSGISTDLQAVATASNSLANVNAAGINSLATSLKNLGTVSIANFVNSLTAGAPLVSSAITAMVSAAANAASSNTAAFSSFGQNLVSSLASGMSTGGATVITGITMVMTTAYGQVVAMSVQFQEAGRTCMVSFVNGITSTPTFVVTSFTTTILTALMSIRSYYSSFYSAGGYLAQGFANGISASSFAAVIAARAMALAAKEAAYAALGIASPSKVFRRIGEYVGEGFVLGIGSYESDSYSAGYSMADKVRLGFTKAIGNIQTLIENGIETQPTIRPVLDLSAVQNGANELNGLFVDRSLALAGANVGISANRSSELDGMFNRLGSMNDASNKEVVSAITSLREDFADLVTTISSLQVRMDSGTVVGELIGKIDTRLGQMATYKGRRN